MNGEAAKDYYIGYNSLDRFSVIVFIHYYLCTWSIAFCLSLLIPLLFALAPASLGTSRTPQLLIVSMVSLSNMFRLYFEPYMISGAGELNLSFHTCRFVVYISSFAKPVGLYLTFLFSIERLFTKVLSPFLKRTSEHRQLFKRLYTVVILLGTLLFVTFRLFTILKLLPRDRVAQPQQQMGKIDPQQDTSDNSTDSDVSFKKCFRSINIDTYATILSFYMLDSWLDFLSVCVIILVILILIARHCCLPRLQRRTPSQLSVNTKLYLSLSCTVVVSECLILYFHHIVDSDESSYTDSQTLSLKLMLFVFNLRSILLPLIVCLTTCDPLKQWLYELLVTRPYLDNVDENDTDENTVTETDRQEPFSAPPRQRGIQQKLRRSLGKNNEDFFDNDSSLPPHADL